MTPQKLKFSSEESLEVLQRVKWTVYAEVLTGADGDVVACTPHPLMDAALHKLHVSTRYVHGHVHNNTLTLSPYTQIFDVQVCTDTDEGDDDDDDVDVFRNVGKGDSVMVTLRGCEGVAPVSTSAPAAAQIEWSSVLSADASDHTPYERTGEAGAWSMEMLTHGYCSAVSLFRAPSGRAWPRKWCGIQLKLNAVGVARALDEAAVEVEV